MRIEKGFNTVSDKQNLEKKRAASKKKQNLTMFISIFMVLLIIFLGFAKMLSPDIDISLGDDNYNYQEDEEKFQSVDSRLKALKAEDEDNYIDESQIVEEDGLVKIPHHKEQENLDEETRIQEDSIVNTQNTEASEKQIKQETDETSKQEKANTPQETPPSKTYRVYVGMYSSQAQAEVARDILQEAGLGVSPNIKQISGGYTLQVGAFSQKDSATALSSKLLLNNYPARVSAE